ncbi:hypothetical protein ABBQ38_005930 [Trebouxia sp. C0009 RCD-2024]
MAPKMLGRDSSRSKSQLGVGALMLGFVFLSWIVLLAGVSAVQHEAHNRNALEFEWWIIAFEFFLVVLAALELAGFRRGHSGLVALKAVNTALIMFYCQTWNNNRRSVGVFSNYKSVRTTFAGFVLLAIANSLLILSMGTEPHQNRDAQYGAPVATGPVGIQGTRATNMEGGQGQTVV